MTRAARLRWASCSVNNPIGPAPVRRAVAPIGSAALSTAATMHANGSTNAPYSTGTPAGSGKS